jgi:homoprotocatechuate degradation regulator HpaR
MSSPPSPLPKLGRQGDPKHHAVDNDACAPAPERPFLRRNLPLLLLQAREGVLAQFRPILRAHGVTEQQWRIIRVLVERGPMEPRELVVQCCISSPSLTGVLLRMEVLGLIERARLAADQRRMRVTATPKAQALAQAMAQPIEAVYRQLEARLAGHLGAAPVQQLYQLLDQWVLALELPGPADQGNLGAKPKNPGA